MGVRANRQRYQATFDTAEDAARILGVSPQTIRHAYSGAWVLPYAYVEPTAWVPPRTPTERAATLAVDALSDESRERLKAMLERAMPSHYPRTRPRTRGDA